MSVPHASYDPRKVFLLSCPSLNFKHKRTVGVYLAGILFAVAQWLFFDAAILSAHAHPPADSPREGIPVHVSFIDWLPGILTTLGLVVVSLVDKETLVQGDGREVWRARFVLFIGFALMAGGLAGSVVVLTIKYVLGKYGDRFLYYGYAAVGQNITLMLAAVVLWLATQSNTEYEYSLTL